MVPIVETFSRAQYYVGPFGAASKLKFVANLLVAIHNVAAAEALVLARQAGLDPAMVLEAVSDGAGSSRVLQLRGPMMVAGDYSAATMKLDVWKKDMTIIAEFARRRRSADAAVHRERGDLRCGARHGISPGRHGGGLRRAAKRWRRVPGAVAVATRDSRRTAESG